MNLLFNTARAVITNHRFFMGMSSFYKEHCIYLPAMVGWFFFSALLSSYNKYVFGKDHMAFPCPLLLTSVHFTVQWIFSYLTTSLYPEALGGHQVKSMPWSEFLCIAIPCGLVTSADVGFSNLALVRISITFYTMVKASSPIFVVLSAYCLGIEKITWMLLLVVLIITVGELLTVVGEKTGKFDFVGFMFCLVSAVLSGMRWTVIQLQLKRVDPPLKSTLATMRILTPMMSLSMIVWAIGFEKPWDRLDPNKPGTTYFDTFEDGCKTIAMGLIGAFLAICMILCEFYLILKSSAIVLMIGGVVKEMITIFVGVYAFHDQINAINMLGAFIVFLGVILYKISLHLSKLERTYVQTNGDVEDLDQINLSKERNGYQSDVFSATDEDEDEDEDGNNGYDEIEGLLGRSEKNENNDDSMYMYQLHQMH